MSHVSKGFLLLVVLALSLCACDVFRQTPSTSISSTPTPSAGLSSADQALQRGDAFFTQGEYAQAIDAYTEALVFAPNSAEAFNNRGLAYLNSGDPDKAFADFNQAILLRPDYANALTNRAIILFDRGDYDGVIRDASHAIELDPNADSAYMFLGNAFERKGNYFAAARNWAQANAIRIARKNQ